MAELIVVKKVVEGDFAIAIGRIGESSQNIVEQFQQVIDKMNASASDEYWARMHRDIFEAAIDEMEKIKLHYKTNLCCLCTLLKEVHLSFVETDNIASAFFKYTDARQNAFMNMESSRGFL